MVAAATATGEDTQGQALLAPQGSIIAAKPSKPSPVIGRRRRETNMTDNVTSMPGIVIAREFIKFDDGTWGLAEWLGDTTRPDHAELMASAEWVVARQLKDVLSGRAPIFGREWLMQLCARIIEEDFNPDGPQTECYDLGDADTAE
jgi:hypothetical protein